MNYNNIAKKYTTASHNTSKIRQIIMLYEGMIKFMMSAKISIENKEIENRYNMIEKTIKIIVALKAALDFNIEGNVAQVLSEYYEMIHKKLMKIHINHDMKICDEVLEALSVMKKTWIEIEQNDLVQPHNLVTDFKNLKISI